MKIVILNDMLWGGGRERRIVQLITGLNRLGVNQITLILLDDRVDYPEVYDLNVNVIKIKRKNSRDFSVFWKLFIILKNIKPDIVNPWSFMTVFYAAPVSLLLGSSCIGAFIVDSKSPHFFSINGVAKILGFLFCSKIVANSQAGHRAYRTPASKQVVIYNGFNETRLQNNHNSLDKKYKNNTDLVITMIGRVDPQKDYYTFIDALAILKERKHLFSAYIVGQGPMIDDIKNYAKNKCGDIIKFTGFLSDVDSIIRETDIGVLCTKIENHAEGISNAILEFMAHGKPVVATDTGGTPEIIENNLSGFLVKPNNPNELAEKILNLIESNDLRINMGRRGSAIVENKFSLDVMARKFKDLYHDSQ